MERLTQQGVVRGFGKGRQVPKRLYSLEDLRLNKIQPEQLLLPTDDTLGKIRAGFQVRAPAAPPQKGSCLDPAQLDRAHSRDGAAHLCWPAGRPASHG